MKLRKFRAESKSSEALAIHPSAIGADFGQSSQEVDENEGIAIVNVRGPLEHHFCWWFDSYDAILCRIDEALDDPSTKALVMCFDSPGGAASGVEEAHRAILRMRETHGKPIFAYSNEACYSAAYWIACAADELWLPLTGGAGSVGVIATVVDCVEANKKAGVKVELVTTGKRKADGHPDRPITADILKVTQARVDQLGEVFFASVASARGTTADAVRALEAGIFLGQDAVGAGLADGVAGWDEFLATVRSAVNDDPGLDVPTTGGVHLGSKAPEQATGRSTSNMAIKLLALTKAKADAKSALEKAKTPEERATALAAFEQASEEEAKVKYSKKTTTVETEDDDGGDDDEDPPADEESEEEESAEAEDDDEDAEEESEDEEASADEAKQAKTIRSLVGKNGAQSVERIYRSVVKLTGKADVSEAIGALDALGSRIQNVSKLESRLNRLEGETRKSKVDAMVNKACTEGRITPAAKASLAAQGMKDPKWLKGHLAALPKNVRRVDEPLRQPAAGTATPAFDAASLSPDQRRMVEDLARDAKLTFDDALAKMNARIKTSTPAIPTH